MPQLIIGFSKAKSILKIGSQLIKTAEHREYSHVFIRYFDELTKLDMIAQASHGMVNETFVELFTNQNFIVKQYKLEVNNKQYLDVLTFIKSNLGKPYSKIQLVLIAIKKALGIELNIRNHDDAFICSELAARVCQILKIDISDLDYTTPSDLDKILEKVLKPE